MNIFLRRDPNNASIERGMTKGMQGGIYRNYTMTIANLFPAGKKASSKAFAQPTALCFAIRNFCIVS